MQERLEGYIRSKVVTEEQQKAFLKKHGFVKGDTIFIPFPGQIIEKEAILTVDEVVDGKITKMSITTEETCSEKT